MRRPSRSTSSLGAGLRRRQRLAPVTGAVTVVLGAFALFAPSPASAAGRLAATAAVHGVSGRATASFTTPRLPAGVRYDPQAAHQGLPPAPGGGSVGRPPANDLPPALRRPVPASTVTREGRRAVARSRGLTTGAVPATTVEITSVSCWSSKGCLAVGYDDAWDLETSYALQWNGTTWSEVKLPLYVDDGEATESELEGVSCVSAAFCVAVGFDENFDDSALTFVWKSGAWHLDPAPAPENEAALSAVSCFTASFCAAVGSVDGAGFADTYDGAWTATTVPSLSSDYYYGVSCPSATYCLAVGKYASDDALVSELSGTTWTQVTADEPGDQNLLDAVSCPTAEHCVAVGYQYTGAQYLTLVETFSVAADVATVESAASGRNPGISWDELYGVSCTSATSCVAVGDDSSDGYGAEDALAEKSSGSAWSTLATASEGTGAYAELASVSCASATSCVAAGFEGSASTNDSPVALLEHRSNKGFTALATPLLRESEAWVDSVTCVSTTFCLAAGGFYTGETDLPLVELWNGSTWRLVAVPTAGIESSFNGASCASATFCQLVGYFDASFGSGPNLLVVTFDGSGFTTVDLPPSDILYAYSELYQVSCSSSTSCVAVGQTEYGDTPVAVVLSGKRYAIVAMPQPLQEGDPYAVSCVSATDCEATVEYDADDATGSDVSRWNGTSWSETVLNVTGAEDVEAEGIDCFSAKRCVATGEVLTHTGWQPFSAIYGGSKWTTRVIAYPSGAAEAYLEGVACTSATSCVAVGGALTPTGDDDRPFVATLSGSNWSDSSYVGTGYGDLYSVSCPSKSVCFASGTSYPGDTGYNDLLAKDHNGTWSVVR